MRGMPRKLPLKRHHCPVQGRRNYSIAYISKTAYRMHLGPSPFDSVPRTLRDMKLSLIGTKHLIETERLIFQSRYYQLYCTLIRECAFILSKVYKPALLLETAPTRGKIEHVSGTDPRLRTSHMHGLRSRRQEDEMQHVGQTDMANTVHAGHTENFYFK